MSSKIRLPRSPKWVRGLSGVERILIHVALPPDAADRTTQGILVLSYLNPKATNVRQPSRVEAFPPPRADVAAMALSGGDGVYPDRVVPEERAVHGVVA